VTAQEIEQRLRTLGNTQEAIFLQRFFKTGPGEYGEGDVFLGLRVPTLRKLAKEYRGLPVEEMQLLLHSPHHEARLLALLLLVQAFQREEGLRQTIYELYLANTARVNNWDLVDSSAEHIVGGFLWERSRQPLRRLGRSASLWERRIAILSTFHFIRRNDFADTLRVAALLLGDPEDLIHKAVGWMLREVGKRDQPAEEAFLVEHRRQMPRTMLRYAIERFPEDRRRQYLKGTL
jgi:3-methyladenine DNA glycosylase AlkD